MRTQCEEKQHLDIWGHKIEAQDLFSLVLRQFCGNNLSFFFFFFQVFNKKRQAYKARQVCFKAAFVSMIKNTRTSKRILVQATEEWHQNYIATLREFTVLFWTHFTSYTVCVKLVFLSIISLRMNHGRFWLCVAATSTHTVLANPPFRLSVVSAPSLSCQCYALWRYRCWNCAPRVLSQHTRSTLLWLGLGADIGDVWLRFRKIKLARLIYLGRLV